MKANTGPSLDLNDLAVLARVLEYSWRDTCGIYTLLTVSERAQVSKEEFARLYEWSRAVCESE